MGDKLTVADFFCGAGGFSEGFRQAGFDIVFAVDNWEPARQTHSLNHPNAKHPGLDCDHLTKGDVLLMTPEYVLYDMPDVDVIIGSPPCISFSSSNRAGKADKSLGVVLIEKYLQIIALKKYKPNPKVHLKYWLMENVPNSKEHVKDKYTFKMLGLTNDILKNLNIHKKETEVALEIDLDDTIFNAVHYGVPQNRLRFICGHYPKPAKTTSEKDKWVKLGYIIDGLKSGQKKIKDPNYEPIIIEEKDLTDHYYDTIIPPFEWQEAKIKKQQARYYGRMSFPEDPLRPSRTIMATRSVLSRESMILPNGSPDNFRSPTVREVASIMSFPITYQFQANNEASKYRLVGNAVCSKMAFEFAKEILKKENKRLIHKYESSADVSKLSADLRKKNPPKKMPRDKHPRANFAEIVPDLKYHNFRVELDNNMPRMNGNRILWSASIHHATGIDSMKKSVPNTNRILLLLNSYSDKKVVEAYITSVKHEFNNKIPIAKEFQSQHCKVKIDHRFSTPRSALQSVKSLVDKHFPEEKYEMIVLNNIHRKKQIIKFNHGKLPDDNIPLRVVAALYACNYIAKLTRGKTHG